MEKSQIADILVNSNSTGEIPIFLDIDNEIISLDFQKISGVLFYGKKATNNMMKVARKINNKQYVITPIESVNDLQNLYNSFLQVYKQKTYFIPSNIILIDNIETLYNYSQEIKDKLIEILRKGHGVNLYFLCGSNDSKLSQDISVNFSVKVEDFYSTTQLNYNAIFDYIGKRQKINIK